MIQDKPFLFSEMLRRTIFKGRPNYFNAKDLNKELLIIHSFVEEFNKAFGVASNIDFTFGAFSETIDVPSNTITRVIDITWNTCNVLYKGVKLSIPSGGQSAYSYTYPVPDESTAPKGVKPPTYFVLTGDLTTVTYATDPVLCGIQADELPSSVPTVDVEQYQNLTIVSTHNPAGVAGVICVLGALHPKYLGDGTESGFGFLYYAFRNPDIRLKNGMNRLPTVLQANQSMFEYILERVLLNVDKVLNEVQLVKRFNLADLNDFDKARKNIGLNNIVNHRQLVRAENFNDLTDKPLARYNLGLRTSATMPIGGDANSLMRGDALPVGAICMWAGDATTIPKNWALCNGQNKNTVQTPDLRGRFIVGLSNTDSDFTVIGNNGGVKKVTLVKENIPPHHHDYNYPTGDHFSGDKFDAAHHDNPETRQSSDWGGNLDGTTEPHDNMPPYYVLAYIMFVGYEVPTVDANTPPSTNPTLVYPNYSTPDTTSDNGYSTYTPVTVGSNNGQTVGAGITLTNPE